MVVSLTRFAGSCYRQTWLFQLYLFTMFFIIAAPIGFVIFAFSVTDKGHGEAVLDRGYYEYQLSYYSGWLRDRVYDNEYWSKISSCLRDAKACRGMAKYGRDAATGFLVPETADMFFQRELSPIQVCKVLIQIYGCLFMC